MARLMKHSGVDWIGDIPADWDCCKLKYLISSLNSGTSITATDLTEDGYPVYGGGQQIGFFSQFNIEDTLIIGRVGSCGHVTKILGKAWATDNALIVTTDFPINYLYYILVAAELNELSTSNAQPLITSRKVLNHKVAVCWDKDEQERIAAYLDDKCGRIDSVIAKTVAAVAEYKKLKQAIITRAVTKGIRPNRPTKDSGIEWLGDIPSDWTTPKLSSICSVITDYVASGSFASLAENVEYLDEPDYAMLIRTADVSNKGYTPKPVYINQHAYKFLSNSNLFGGELMFPNIGASVGDVYIVPVLYERMSLAPNAIMVKTNQIDKYYYYYFQSKPGRLSIEDIAQSTAQAKFNKTDFRQLRVLLPPLDEQKEIAVYLDEKTAAIDSLVAKKIRLVAELERLKKSLIFEYVTGKKEVAQ